MSVNQNELETWLKELYPEFSGCHVECLKTIDSTNTYAKNLLAGATDITGYNHAIITADTQTAGRGRIGRTFESPADTGVYVSLIITPKVGITQPALITVWTAVAACRAIKNLYDTDIKIKWINDLYVNNDGELKKCAGILTEGVTDYKTGLVNSAVIGIGINIKPSVQIQNSSASDIAGYLTKAPETKDTLSSQSRFVAEIAGQVFRILNEPATKVIAEYKSKLFLIGQSLTVHPLIGDDKTSYTATAIDIDENAGLIVRLSDGTTKTLSSGEVSLHHCFE